MLFVKPSQLLRQRLVSLQENLVQENPLLVDAVDSFQILDKAAYRLGLLGEDESYATRISWWPLISVLGTFSAGKSSFINTYLGVDLQRTGNQAVDDKFTVVSYSQEDEVRLLPGYALDADPRFPLYRISDEIEKVAQGEGSRIDNYLQLKICPSDKLKGCILIDSPGFDADEQRNSTLRITDHIIDLSDLVLLFFDARHPEPGAMQDTLKHLVSKVADRSDAGKFLFILNQIDVTAKEDNMEEVVSAWQRGIAQHGITTGRFYCIYNESIALEIKDPNTQQRYQTKRDEDLKEIISRMEEVSVERVYRIIASLENIADRIERETVPTLTEKIYQWRKQVLFADAMGMGVFMVLSLLVFFMLPWSLPEIGQFLLHHNYLSLGLLVIIMGTGLFFHFSVRNKFAQRIAKTLPEDDNTGNWQKAFLHNTASWRSLLWTRAIGWGRGTHKVLSYVRQRADEYVKALNNQFTNPSGK